LRFSAFYFKKVFAYYAKITQKYGKIHPIIVDLLVSEKGEEEFKETFLLGLKNLYAEVITIDILRNTRY
jgi:hypothetical protein